MDYDLVKRLRDARTYPFADGVRAVVILTKEEAAQGIPCDLRCVNPRCVEAKKCQQFQFAVQPAPPSPQVAPGENAHPLVRWRA